MRQGGFGRVLVAAAVVAAGVSTAPAEAVTFGSDLSRAPTNTYTCGMNIPPFGLSSGTSSCMYFSLSPSPYAPASGTVTAVHVRVGAITGPMQVVMMRSLYQNHFGDPGHPYFACCFVERYGPIFTPQPETVTTVPVELPMTEEPTPPPEDFTTNAAGDFLALSVLAPDVPIPISIDKATVVSGFYPAPTVGTVAAPAPNPIFQTTELEAGQVLLSADIRIGAGAPAGGGQPGGGAGRGGAGVPAVNLPRSIIPINGNTATVPVQCLVLDCRGNIALQNAPAGGLARVAAKARPVTYGTATFSIKAGTTARVKVKLSAAGRRAVRRSHRVRAWANLAFSSGGGSAKSIKVTLSR